MLEELPRQATGSIEAVAMDMWQAYINAVKKALPEAAIGFDKFPIKKHLNDGVDKVRRTERRELSAAGNMALKGMTYCCASVGIGQLALWTKGIIRAS